MCSKIKNNSDSVLHWVRQVTGRYNQIKNLKEIENKYGSSEWLDWLGTRRFRQLAGLC